MKLIFLSTRTLPAWDEEAFHLEELNVMRFIIALWLAIASSLAIAQEAFDVQASTLYRPQDGSSVLLLEMVHFGPVAYYKALTHSLEKYAADKKNIAVLLEGVQCHASSLALRDPVNRWPFPTVSQLESNFSQAELSLVRDGFVTNRFQQFFRRVFARNLEERGIDFYYYLKPCDGHGSAQTASAAYITKLPAIDSAYAQLAKQLNAQTGIPSIAQIDRENPLWQSMEKLSQGGSISKLVYSDVDRSSLNLRDLEHLIWISMLATQESGIPFVNPAFPYLTQVWAGINNLGFRNQFLFGSLTIGMQQGVKHFVIPWGESHSHDIKARLESLGFKPKQEETIRYAPCTYVNSVTAKTSCHF